MQLRERTMIRSEFQLKTASKFLAETINLANFGFSNVGLPYAFFSQTTNDFLLISI